MLCELQLAQLLLFLLLVKELLELTVLIEERQLSVLVVRRHVDLIIRNIAAIVFGNVKRQALFLESGFNKHFTQLYHNGKQRYGQNQCKGIALEDRAHDYDRDQHAKCADAHLIAQDLGADDVALQLLDQEYQNDIQNKLGGVSDQDDKATGNCTDQRTDDGNDIRNTDQNGDEHEILRNIKDPEAEQAEQENDRGVQHLAYDIVAKGAVDGTHDSVDKDVLLLGEDCLADLLDLCQAGLLGGKQMECDQDAEERVEHDCIDLVDQRAGIGEQLFQNLFQQGGGVLVKQIGDLLHQALGGVEHRADSIGQRSLDFIGVDVLSAFHIRIAAQLVQLGNAVVDQNDDLI